MEREMRLLRKQKNTVFKQGAILLASMVVCALIFKFVLGDKLTELTSSGNTLYQLVAFVIALDYIIQIAYAYNYRNVSSFVDDEPDRFASNLMPILSDINLLKFAGSCEIYPLTLFIINIFTSIIKYTVGIGGYIYLYMRHGFLIIHDPHMTWIMATIIVCLLSSIMKAAVFGYIYSCFDDYLVTIQHTSILYLKYLLLGVIILIYIISIPLSSKLGFQPSAVITRIMNLIIFGGSFIIPILSAIDAYRVKVGIRQYLYVISQEDEEDDEY